MVKATLKTATFTSSICLAFFPVFANAEESRPSTGASQLFIQSFCIDCHNDQEPNGEIDLDPLLQNQSAVDRQLLISVYDQINLEQMPPDDEVQPTSAERAKMLTFLDEAIRASGAFAINKKLLPGYGNYVDHDRLFEAKLTEPQTGAAPRI